MKYVDEFRNKGLIDRVAGRIEGRVEKGRVYNIMEVCGTHTMNIFRFGLRDILPKNINLISGPGCPVCVTPNDFIDKAIELTRMKEVIIATFGDMMRVPGSHSTLEKERARGADIRMVYSTIDAISIAKRNQKREVVFLGIGFETTAPTVAQSIIKAKNENLKNYSVLCGHKTMPKVLKVLAEDENINIDGFLLPGHVSAVIGVRPYEFLAKKYNRRCVIAGFEPLDILQSILMLVEQDAPKVEIQYTRIIEKDGNALARHSIEKAFENASSVWRGIGRVKDSGLKIRDGFSDYDAEVKFDLKVKPSKDNADCICGGVLKGMKSPLDCRLFRKVCNPENPVGACMVSSEGTCAAYFKYRVKGQGSRVKA